MAGVGAEMEQGHFTGKLLIGASKPEVTSDADYIVSGAVVIERVGKPVAVLVTVERFQAMERNRENLLEMIDRVPPRNKDVPTEVWRPRLLKPSRRNGLVS